MGFFVDGISICLVRLIVNRIFCDINAGLIIKKEVDIGRVADLFEDVRDGLSRC